MPSGIASMLIEDSGSVVRISDKPGEMLFGRLLALTVAGAFWVYAVNEWISYVTLPHHELSAALGVTAGALFAGLVGFGFVTAPYVTTTVDRASRKVTVEHRRWFSEASIFHTIQLDDIVKVYVRGPDAEGDCFISIIQRSGPPIELSRFSKSHDAAQDVAATFEALKKTGSATA